jgi:WxL domain surface cell wall-binding
MCLAAAAAACLVLAQATAAAVTVNATVTGGTTLSVASLNTPSFALTLNGDDQTGTYQAQFQVVDARGLATGGGWNLTIGATQFSDGAGHTLPATADTITSVAAACHTGSTCALPTNGVSNTNLAIPLSPSTSKFLNAASSTGLGRIDVTANVGVLVPAGTVAAAYSSTLTFAVATGP